MAELEKAGIPTVSFVASGFSKAWNQGAPLFGVEELSGVLMPRPFVGMKAEDIYPLVDAAADSIVTLLMESAAQRAPSSNDARPAEIIVVEGENEYVAFEKMNRLFLAEGWGDGFPLWAPTRERVDAMLKGTRRAAGDVVAIVAPGMGLATVEKIAINAVMAGCRPEHLSVLIAAVEAISDPLFMMRSVAMSTGAHAPLMLVNGPIVKRLGINTGRCALGPGAQSEVNTVLGRAIRLIYMNIGHAYPGAMDMDTLGSPTKYSMCVGENEEASPWEPFHVEKGFDRETSVVTMFTNYAITEVEDGTSNAAEGILDTAVSTACNQGVKSVGYWLLGWRGDPQAGVQAKDKSLLIVCPVHAEVFRKSNFSRQQIRDYLYKHARLPFRLFMANKEAGAFRASHPQLQWLWDSPDTLLPVLETPDCFDVIVAGAMGGARSTYCYGAGEPVSRSIEQ
jgi:hypothetical protein